MNNYKQQELCNAERGKDTPAEKVDLTKPEYKVLLESIDKDLAEIEAADAHKSKVCVSLGFKLLDEQEKRGRGFIKTLKDHYKTKLRMTQTYMSIARMIRSVSDTYKIDECVVSNLFCKLSLRALKRLSGKNACLPGVRAEVLEGLQKEKTYDEPMIQEMIKTCMTPPVDSTGSQPVEPVTQGEEHKSDAVTDTPLSPFQKISPELANAMGTFVRFATDFSGNPLLLLNALDNQEKIVVLSSIDRTMEQLSTIRRVLAGDSRSYQPLESRPGFRGYVDQAHRGPQHPSLALQSGKH